MTANSKNPAPNDYWNSVAEEYQRQIKISCDDFHFGPLIPGNRQLDLLPAIKSGTKCLELGCGGGQNSIYLARQGGHCIAVDKSRKMLAWGQRLARQYQVEIEFHQADLGKWTPDLRENSLDLVHSAYALPFLEDPEKILRQAACLLRQNGWMVISTAHPLTSAEWIETEDGEKGIFLENYFSPPAGEQVEEQGSHREICRSWPLSTIFSWLTKAGLEVKTMNEPRPLHKSSINPSSPPPYVSETWNQQYVNLRAIPPVVVFVARKSDNNYF